jgi:hypothetical protein
MRKISIYLTLAAVFGLASSVRGAYPYLVHDTWLDGTRTDPGSPTYAENNGVLGSDADHDGDRARTRRCGRSLEGNHGL